ncbi:hypothetical protein ABDD95_19135 [Mucilaginibacter sp. PAMB04274]|uniref:hypothetical protein n=1 Tax=Mucilaginibacter sp. PAMB04274 TaxID=3138568 RepID=UPI0031F6224A
MNHRNSDKYYDQQVTAIRQFYINFASPEDIYLQLATHLQKFIEKQDFDIERPLPSVYYIHRTLNVSRASAYRAYAELNRNNLVYWMKGKGFYAKLNSPE